MRSGLWKILKAHRKSVTNIKRIVNILKCFYDLIIPRKKKLNYLKYFHKREVYESISEFGLKLVVLVFFYF